MAGKAPLLLASLLFTVGATGLALTSAERASWGPFEPRGPQPPSKVVIVDASRKFADPPDLAALLTPQAEALRSHSEALVAAPEATPPEPTPTETPVPTIWMFGISADGSGVSAAAQEPTPPPPLRIPNVGTDDPVEATETPEPAVSEEEPEEATPAP